jgi:hypothetical protein
MTLLAQPTLIHGSVPTSSQVLTQNPGLNFVNFNVNRTGNDIDTGGWEIHDLTGPRHIFIDTLLIPARCVVVVFGGGTPMGAFGNAAVQVSSTSTLGLNNSGDTIKLYDISMTAVDIHAFGSKGGDNQSITRDPDIISPDPKVKLSLAAKANGALFSAGTKVDCSPFDGCSFQVHLK